MERLVQMLMVGLLCTTATGCLFGGDTVLDADDYDRSCTTNDDCAIVYGDGDVCRCPDAVAIRASEVDEFEADYDRKFSRCRAVPGCPAPPYQPVAECNAGTCEVREVYPEDAGPGADAGGSGQLTDMGGSSLDGGGSGHTNTDMGDTSQGMFWPDL
jgi:hypothetical protein